MSNTQSNPFVFHTFNQGELVERLRSEGLRSQQEGQEYRAQYLQLQQQLADGMSHSAQKDTLLSHLRSEIVYFMH